MNDYLEKIDQTPSAARWRLVRDWMDSEPLALYEILREHRPVLKLPELTIVTRYADCSQVLRQHDLFSVALYAPKQGGYWMSQDDTAQHWREKSIMRSILDLEDLPKIRAFVSDKASKRLQRASGNIEAVNDLTRAVPIDLIREFFNFDESDPKDLVEWSYWSQYDAFHNQPFDSIDVDDPQHIIEMREKSSIKLGKYLQGLLKRRGAELKAGQQNNDPTTRVLRLVFSEALKFDLERAARNIGGLLIGTVETTSHAAINAIEQILARPAILSSAIEAAAEEDPTEVDGYVFEAMRFKPAFPYFFRTCEQDTQLASNTEFATDICKGKTVMALTHSAMFDAAAFPNPTLFDPSRPMTNAFHFGQGLHECLGRHIGGQMIPEIVRQVLRLPGIREERPIRYLDGPVPEDYRLAWDFRG